MDSKQQQQQQQQARPRRPEQQQPPPPTKMVPKVPLTELDARFVADMDDKALSGITRTYAGRMHQLLLHVGVINEKLDSLARARDADVKQVLQAFEQLLGRLPELEAAASDPPAADATHAGQSGGQAIAPEAAAAAPSSAPAKLPGAPSPTPAIVASAPPPPKAGKRQ